jgi:MFS family permease
LGNALAGPALGGIYLGATNDKNRGQVMGIRGSAISAAVMLGPLAQALVGAWITPQITFAIGVLFSLLLTVIAFLLLKNPRQA